MGIHSFTCSEIEWMRIDDLENWLQNEPMILSTPVNPELLLFYFHPVLPHLCCLYKSKFFWWHVTRKQQKRQHKWLNEERERIYWLRQLEYPGANPVWLNPGTDHPNLSLPITWFYLLLWPLSPHVLNLASLQSNHSSKSSIKEPSPKACLGSNAHF